MPKKNSADISTESYKGVRDFYPEEMFIQKQIFDVMRKTAENFGYVEYNASILEPAELYEAKSGDEIVNEQTYTFKDRGGRQVTLRPEMTPTVARMVAARKRELSFPLRWYSLPNLFRYEQPQRGRLREHWQLNVDLFGIQNERAEIEIVSVAYQLLKNLGAKNKDFEIRLNDRNLIDAYWSGLDLSKEKIKKLSQVIDKRDKIGKDVYDDAIAEITPKYAEKIISAFSSGQKFSQSLKGHEIKLENFTKIIEGLDELGIKNVVFSPTLIRGLDYYTGFVFEIFDINKSNPRSLAGGGRYDNLLSIFNSELVPAVGFGAGDVTIRDFLDTHKLLPNFVSPTKLYIGVTNERFLFADAIAENFRDRNVSVAVDYSDKSVSDKIKKAVKDKIPYFAVIGEIESKDKTIKVKKLENREEKSYSLDDKGLNECSKEILGYLNNK